MQGIYQQILRIDLILSLEKFCIPNKRQEVIFEQDDAPELIHSKNKEVMAGVPFFPSPKPNPSQKTNVYLMVVQCSQMFENIFHSITVFNEYLFDVCEDSSKCEKRLCLAGTKY